MGVDVFEEPSSAASSAKSYGTGGFSKYVFSVMVIGLPSVTPEASAKVCAFRCGVFHRQTTRLRLVKVWDHQLKIGLN